MVRFLQGPRRGRQWAGGNRREVVGGGRETWGRGDAGTRGGGDGENGRREGRDRRGRGDAGTRGGGDGRRQEAEGRGQGAEGRRREAACAARWVGGQA